jgi:hypothetical protein
MSLDFWGLESVGAQQRGEHVDADHDNADRPAELDEHGQILRSPRA